MATSRNRCEIRFYRDKPLRPQIKATATLKHRHGEWRDQMATCTQ
jgi:hypothetical protein